MFVQEFWESLYPTDSFPLFLQGLFYIVSLDKNTIIKFSNICPFFQRCMRGVCRAGVKDKLCLYITHAHINYIYIKFVYIVYKERTQPVGVTDEARIRIIGVREEVG